MTTLQISLNEDMNRFVEAEVRARGYETASDYFAMLLRDAFDAKHQNRLHALIQEGRDSGEPTSFTDQDFEAIQREVHARAAQNGTPSA